MRGKVARQLRQELNYKINREEKKNREYHDLEVRVLRPIYSFNSETNSLDIVKREVSAFIRECVSGQRKIYQYLKKKWNNDEYEAKFQQLPEVDEMVDLAKQIINDDELKASSQGGNDERSDTNDNNND